MASVLYQMLSALTFISSFVNNKQKLCRCASIPQVVYDIEVRYIPKSISLAITVRSNDIKVKFSTKPYYDLTVGISLFYSNH